MNILITSPHGLYEDYSFSFVHNQAKAYVELGHRVRAVIPLAVAKKDDCGKRFGKWIETRNVNGVEIYYVRYLSLGGFGARKFNRKSAELTFRFLMRQILTDFHPDVIHGHTLDFGSEVGIHIKEQTNCPLVVTTHGGDTNVPFEKGQYDLLKTYCAQMDAVVAVSNKLKERLESCGTHVPIRVIHNGYVPHALSQVYKKSQDAMIQVGNLIPSKNFDVTIRAFARLRENRPDLELTIIGQGPLRNELEALCQQLGVGDAVHFLGQLPNEKVSEKMCESTFFVMASKPEGFGIVYLEAMAASCVVIGTESEGIADIITHGKNGFLVPAGNVDAVVDVIQSCINEPQRASTIADFGRKTAQEMTWEQNAKKYQTLFETLLQGENP